MNTKSTLVIVRPQLAPPGRARIRQPAPFPRDSGLRAALLAALLGVAGCGGHPRPTTEEARIGMADFLRGALLENTQADPMMAQILSGAAGGALRRPVAGAFVHQQGTALVDGAGQPLQLKGVNLGGAYLWEGWIFGGAPALLELKLTGETYIRAGIQDLLGPESVATFESGVYNGFVAASDLAQVAAMGFNLVRLPINHRLLSDPNHPGTYREAGWLVLDRALQLAEQAGVYVQLDLHAAPGGQSNFFIADPEKVLLWDSSANKQATVDLWRAIAQRYAGRSIIAAYDLLNEPVLDKGRGAELPALYRDIIAAIRKVDPNHLIMLEGNDFARDFTPFSAALDPNQAYSYHMYHGSVKDTGQAIAGIKAIAQAHGVPVHCGEFGEDGYTGIQTLVQQLEGGNSAGWSYWTWKRAPALSPSLHLIPVTAAWKKTIDFITAP